MGPSLTAEVVILVPKVIVTDLDRTLTTQELRLDEHALAAIAALRAGGIKVVLATGRRLEDLIAMELVGRMDGVVAENGAIVAVATEDLLETRHADFQQQARGALGTLAEAFTWGRVVGSAPREHSTRVADALQQARIPHSMEYNAEELMLLPPGVDKASGAQLCLRRLGLTADDAWAIGDGENDVSMLRWARVGFAPANAAPAARAAADVQLADAYSQAFIEMTSPLIIAESVR